MTNWDGFWGLRQKLVLAEAKTRLPIAAARALVRRPFLLSMHPGQVPPDSEAHPNWRNWLFMGGRGAGKTRAGAEWVRAQCLLEGRRRVALVAPSLQVLREVMVAGPSGLLSLHYGPEDAPRWEASRRRLVFPNGAQAYGFSAEDPDSLRGPQFDAAWCDEIAAWRDGEAVWDTLQMGLRLGEDPRCAATTTPRPVALVTRLVADPSTVVTHAATAANRANLAPGFMARMEDMYGGTHLGRQELGGELIEDLPGALWSRADLEAARVAMDDGAQYERVLVAVDPPASAHVRSDACGIVAAGCRGGVATLLADASVQGLSPDGWAAAAVACAEVTGASEIIAEANQGGEMVRQMLQMAGCPTAIRLVHARVGKDGRAQPVKALYAQGRVRHAGVFAALEDEMCSFGADGATGSPDRVDAMVWAVWALLLDGREPPRVRGM